MKPLETLDSARFDTPVILKKLAASSRRLAELKGLAGSIPNQGILINTLGLQEAKDSSEIENIVTTHDELFKDDVHPECCGNNWRLPWHERAARWAKAGLLTDPDDRGLLINLAYTLAKWGSMEPAEVPARKF